MSGLEGKEHMRFAAQRGWHKMPVGSPFFHLIGRPLLFSLRMMMIVSLFVCPVEYASMIRGAEGDPLDNHEYLTGDPLYRQLQSPLTVSWKRVELRQVLDQLRTTTHVSLVADRQLDPRRLISLEADQKPLYLILFEIARQSGAELSVQANYVFVGTPRNARLLRTMIAQKQEEMLVPGPVSGAGKGRSEDLQWEDLVTPQELLRKIGSKFTLELTNPDEIPHDLLAAGVLPRSNLEQQLCTLLIQYDFSFAWVEPGKTIKLVPLPEKMAITQTHRVPPSRKEQLDAELPRRGGIEWEWISANQLEVSGRVEDQEWVTSQLQIPRKSEPAPVQDEMPLAKRRFTIQQEGVAVKSVIDQLSKLGIEIEFDPAEFAETFAGRNDKADLDLREATPAELCAQLFARTPVQYEVLPDRIVLRPSE